MERDFKQPLKGPKIGPTKEFDELSDDKKAELGDMKKLAQSGIFKPAEMDPQVVAQKTQAPQQEVSSTAAKTPEEIAEEFKALKTVLEDEEPEAPDPLEEDAVPTEEDKQTFLRTVLGNRPYKKTYQLFDGGVLLELADLSPVQEEQLFAALKAEDIKTQAEWETAHDRLRLLAHTNSISWGGKTPTLMPVFPEKTEHAVKEAEALISGFTNTALYRAAMYTVRVFQLHLEMLLGGVLRPDFWQAGGPDSPSEPTTPA